MPRVGSDPNSIVRQHFPNHTLSTFIDGNSRWWQMYQKVTKGGASTSASSSPAASSSSSALAPTSSRPSSAFLSAETRDAVVEHASSTSAPRSASSPLRSSPSSSFPDSTLDVSSDTVHGVRTSRTRWNARLALSPYGQRPLSRWIPSEEKRMEDMFALSEIFPYITEGEELEEEMDLHELIAANLHETNNEEKDTNGHAEKLDRNNPAVNDEVNEEIPCDLQQEPGSQGMSAEEEEDGDESQDEFGSAHSVASGKKEKNKKKKAKARAKAKQKRQKGHTGDAGWVLTMAKLGQLVEALGFDPQKKRDNAELIERVRAALLQAVPERQDAQWQQSVLDELKRMEELTDQMEKWHKQLASGNVENFMAESEKWERELKAQQAKWERQSAEALRLQREEVERQARRRASGEEEQLHEQEEDEESVADSMQGSYSSASESGTGATDPEVEESESDSDNEAGSVEEIRSATPGASSSSDREALLAATPKPPATPFTPSSPGHSLSDPGAKVCSNDPSDTPGFDSIPVNVPQQTSPPVTIPSSIPTDTSATQTSGPINELIITKVPAAVGPSTTSVGSNTPSASTSTPTITRIPVPRLQNVNDPPPPITPRQPINWNIAPPAPANPIEYLTNHPWTMIEVLLLLEVVAHFPPTEHGWAFIADVYNNVLTTKPLQEWFGRQVQTAHEEDQKMKVLLQRMHQERTQLAQVQTEQPAGTTASSSAAAPQGDAARAQSRMPVERSKNAPFGSAEAHAEAQARAKSGGVVPGISPDYDPLQGARLPFPIMEPEVGPSVPAGTAQNPAGNAQLPLLITQSFPRRRPPLTLPSKQARLFARVVADAASGKKATALESRETLNELYKWVGARTPVRTPWDCWHRWCVPWVAAGNTDEPDADMVMPVQPPADGKPTVVLDYVLGNLCAPYQLSAKPAPSPVIIAPVPGTYPRAPGMQHPRIEGVGYDPRSGMAAFARMTHLAAERTWAAQGLGRRIDGAIREDVVTQRRQKRPGTIGGSFGRGHVASTAAPQNASAARPVPSSSAVARSAPAATTGSSSSSTAAATKPIIRAQTLTMTPVSNPQPLVFTPPAPRTPSPASTAVASTPTGAASTQSASTTTAAAAPLATLPANTIPSNAAPTGTSTTTPAAAARPRLRRRDIPAPPARRPPPPPRARPNVPVGTLGSGERPGIRAWFDHATVRVDVLERVMEMSKKRRAFEGSLAAANWTEKAEEEEEEKGKEWGIVPMHLRGIPVPKRARY